VTGRSLGAEGNDSLAGFEAVQGSAFNDSLVGGSDTDQVSYNNTLIGGDGDDTITDTLGHDLLLGGTGNDSIDGGSDNDSIQGDDGADTLVGGALHDSLLGGAGNDSIDGGSDNDSVQGNDGADTLVGGVLHDSLLGGAGNDSIDGGSDNDSIQGDDGADTLVGGARRDSLLGGNDADSLDGGFHNDTLDGGEGDDTLAGGVGNNLIQGHAGIDFISYENLAGSITVDLAGGAANGFWNFEVQNPNANGVISTNFLGHQFYVLRDAQSWTPINNQGGYWFEQQAWARELGGDLATINDATEQNFLVGWLYGHYAPRIGHGMTDLGQEGNFFWSNGEAVTYTAWRSGEPNNYYNQHFGSFWMEQGGRWDDTGGTEQRMVTEFFTAFFDTISGVENVLGSGGHDSLLGDDAANFLSGLAGNDTISGGDGNDTLAGGLGDDSLNGGDGTADWVSFAGASAGVTLDLATPLVTGTDGNDSLTGFEAVQGSAFNDSLVGDTGNNTLAGGLGDDTLDGSAGDADWVSFAGASAGVSLDLAAGSAIGADGNDRFAGFEAAQGSAFNDSLLGSSGNDTLDGGGGNDTLVGGLGDDSLNGGTGEADWASYASASAAITIDLDAGSSSGADGIDSLTGFENVLGGNFNDSILGDENANILVGGEGDDTLVGSAGNDTLYGGNGNDVGDFRGFGSTITVDLFQGLVFDEGGTTQFFDIERILSSGGEATLVRGDGGDIFTGSAAHDHVRGSAGNDEIFGDLGDDDLDGGNGHDCIHGGDGADMLRGGAGHDTLMGGEGNNTFQGGPGNDLIMGGSGRDLVDYSYVTTQGVTVSLQDETAAGGSQDTLNGITDATGSNQNDNITGDGNDNLLTGLSGDDLIRGLGGDDTLDGGFGSDTLLGGAGADQLLGGEGNDFANYEVTASAVSVNLNAGSDVDGAFGISTSADGNDTLRSIEGLIGSDFNDTLIGNAQNNTLIGGNGTDSLVGGGGNDLLNYGAGDDQFDFVSGVTAGNLTLIGGDGNDTLNLGNDWVGVQDGAFTRWTQDGLADTLYSQGWESIVCFAEGTRIVTPNGEDVVERLRAGDMVLAMRDGQAGFEPLRWVGFMDVAVPRNAAMAAKTAPVLIRAGALAPGMPARDLRVSPDHAMEVDGHLIPAKHLVNGESIIQETWCRRVRYFHLELEAHGLLLSEGTWSESYFDDGNRHAFNNAAMTGLFLDFEAGRSKGQYDHLACLPVLRQGLRLDEIHGRIALRAVELARARKMTRDG
jgi:Ca2+-binding RTX toxin-like protein